jgi:hypothetical protein
VPDVEVVAAGHNEELAGLADGGHGGDVAVRVIETRRIGVAADHEGGWSVRGNMLER